MQNLQGWLQYGMWFKVTVIETIFLDLENCPRIPKHIGNAPLGSWQKCDDPVAEETEIVALPG